MYIFFVAIALFWFFSLPWANINAHKNVLAKFNCTVCYTVWDILQLDIFTRCGEVHLKSNINDCYRHTMSCIQCLLELLLFTVHEPPDVFVMSHIRLFFLIKNCISVKLIIHSSSLTDAENIIIPKTDLIYTGKRLKHPQWAKLAVKVGVY